jgi:GAF domain-containing protein
MENNFIGINLIPGNEQERLAELQKYEILDTPPEGAFNHIAQMAARMFEVPIALVSLVDAERVWFKANVGMGNTSNVPRGTSLCSLAILSPEPTVFEDALKEGCLMANPLVTGQFGLRFYAGAPITSPQGINLGTLCIVDKEPRTFSHDEQRVLQNLAQIVMDEIELRYLRKKKAVA